MSAKKKNIQKTFEDTAIQQQKIINNNQQVAAAKESDILLPYNSKKEALGPNTKK